MLQAENYELLPKENLEELMKRIPEWETPLWLYWDDYVEISIGHNKSESTILNVQSILRFLLRHTDRITIESWRDPLESNRFFLTLKQERGLSNSTMNSYSKNLRSYFTFLFEMEKIPKNYLQNIKKSKEENKNNPTLITLEVKAIMWHLNSRVHSTKVERLRSLLYVQLAVVTGARPKELLGITIHSFSKDRREVSINGAKQKWKERFYRVNDYIIETLSQYIKELVRLGRDNELSHHLFISFGKRGDPWTYRGINKLFQRLSKELGLHVTSYMFRRYVCTELFKNQEKIQNIQLFMWHTRVSTTFRYNHNSVDNTKDCSSYLERQVF